MRLWRRFIRKVDMEVALALVLVDMVRFRPLVSPSPTAD
jgi:hypothetical protein